MGHPPRAGVQTGNTELGIEETERAGTGTGLNATEDQLEATAEVQGALGLDLLSQALMVQCGNVSNPGSHGGARESWPGCPAHHPFPFWSQYQ